MNKHNKVSRRDFLKIISILGTTAVLAGWGISRTKFMWQIGEFMALASLGGKAQKANDKKYDGKEITIPYGDNPQQYVLVFPPIESAPQRDSIVFFAHGGGWNMGNPTQYRFVGRFFAQLGFPTILAGYRLTPDFQFPIQIDDTSASLHAGIQYFEQNNIYAKKIILGGHSAGAQLTSLLTYKENITVAERSLFSGLFCMSGPLDFSLCQSVGIKKLLDDYIGNLPNPEVADPIFYADPELSVSVLCIHGAQDPLVSVENSASFAQKLNQGLVKRAQLNILPDKYHSDTMDLFFETTDETRILTDWIDLIDAK